MIYYKIIMRNNYDENDNDYNDKDDDDNDKMMMMMIKTMIKTMMTMKR
jgi:hypothetical protein